VTDWTTHTPNARSIESGVAPADARPRARWPRWRIVLAYAVLFALAIASIWMIDDHVLKATPPATRTVAR
jgi:hypothetical protein